MSYYDKLLKGEEFIQVEKEYKLDILHSSFAGTSLSITGLKEKNVIPRKKTLDSFIEEINSEMISGKMTGRYYFIDYQDNVLIVKRELSDFCETQKYYLTEKARKNRKLLSALALFKENNGDYEDAKREEVNAPLLANLLYGDGKVLITDEVELKRFKKYCESKVFYIGLALRKKLEKKYGFLLNVPIRALVIVLSLISTTLWLNVGFGLFTTVILQFMYQASLSMFYQHKTEAEIKHFIREATLESEEVIELLKKQQEKEELSKAHEDAFVNDIRKAIDKVNMYKYAGYQEHLKFLYKLTVCYLKRQNVNRNRKPGDLFLEDGSLIKALSTIESAIDEAISNQRNETTCDKILAEIAKLTGLPNEVLESGEDVFVVESMQDEKKADGVQVVSEGGVQRLIFGKKK